MKIRALSLLCLLTSSVAVAQRGRPIEIPKIESYPREHELGVREPIIYEGPNRVDPILGEKYRSFEIFVKKDAAKWEMDKETLAPEKFEHLRNEVQEYYLYKEHGDFIFQHCGENVAENFTITENNGIVTISTELKDVNLVVAKDYLLQNKEVRARGIEIKAFDRNGEIYKVENSVSDNGEHEYMLLLREKILVNIKEKNISAIKKNLDKPITKKNIILTSAVRDFKTNQILKQNFAANVKILKSKEHFIDIIKGQEQGTTIFLLGHQNQGKIIADLGKTNFELNAKELDDLSLENHINIFPLGCSSSLSSFKVGPNKKINSLEFSRNYLKSISEAKSFGELLQKTSEYDPELRITVSEGSFGETFVEIKTNMVKINGAQGPSDSLIIASGSIFNKTKKEKEHEDFLRRVEEYSRRSPYLESDDSSDDGLGIIMLIVIITLALIPKRKP